MRIRKAEESDLDEVYDIWYETETEGDDPPPARGANLWFPHVLRTGRMTVAMPEDGGLVGFAGIWSVGPLVVLTDCFVRPRFQSTGIGGALLDALLPTDDPVATFASTDTRAAAGYARRRMIPRWPVYYLLGDARQVSGWTPSRCSVTPAGEEAMRMLVEPRLDPEYLSSIGATSLEIRDEGELVGAATVSVQSAFRLSHAEAATIIESHAQIGRARDLLLAVVGWCATNTDDSIGLQVAGTHEAFPALLELGFHITDVDTACYSNEDLMADPTRTSFCGEPLPAPEVLAGTPGER